MIRTQPAARGLFHACAGPPTENIGKPLTTDIGSPILASSDQRIEGQAMKYVMAVAMALCAAAAQAETVGVHLGTAHSKGGFNGVNPGLYVRTDDGITVGAYRNSHGDASAYAGLTLETADRRFAITGGVVTGYAGPALSPLVVPSVRFHVLGELFARLSLIPKPPRHGSAAGLHLSVEKEIGK